MMSPQVDACTIEVKFWGKTLERPEDTVMVDNVYDNQRKVMVLFSGEEPVRGTVLISPTRKVVHQGIKVELVGQISMLFFF